MPFPHPANQIIRLERFSAHPQPRRSMKLSSQLSALRLETGLSQRALAERADLHPRVIAGLERGNGTLASLEAAAGALGHYVTPYPSALRNKRRHLQIGTPTLARDAGITRPTLRSLEGTGQGRVASYESICSALDEQPRLAAITSTWWTPPTIVNAVLDALAIERFDLDPCSPSTPTVPCHRHLTETDGGLWFEWRGVVWLNPPYDAVPAWGNKAIAELKSGRASKIVGIVPFRPETSHWQTLVESDCQILVLRKRPYFGGRNYTLPSASAIIAWNLSQEELLRLHRGLPENRIMRLELLHSLETIS